MRVLHTHSSFGGTVFLVRLFSRLSCRVTMSGGSGSVSAQQCCRRPVTSSVAQRGVAQPRRRNSGSAVTISSLEHRADVLFGTPAGRSSGSPVTPCARGLRARGCDTVQTIFAFGLGGAASSSVGTGFRCDSSSALRSCINRTKRSYSSSDERETGRCRSLPGVGGKNRSAKSSRYVLRCKVRPRSGLTAAFSIRMSGITPPPSYTFLPRRRGP